MCRAMDAVTAFAPATVSNVACGFDVLGFALSDPGDEVTVRALDDGDSAAPRVLIDDIVNDQGRLPRDPARNTASVAVQAFLEAIGARRGVALTIRKGLPLSSGLGGSAASAVAAVVAADALLGANASRETLMACAFEGERLAAGSAHGDNIGPAVYGGFVLVRVANPPDVIRLPIPARSDRGGRAPGSRNRNRARAGAARCDGAARGCHPAMGESRHVRRRAPSRRLRSDGAVAPGFDRRTAPRPAGARARAHQACRG